MLLLSAGAFPGYTADPVPPAESVSFLSADGVRLAGHFIRSGKHKSAVILLHGLGSNYHEWDAFATQLAQAGYDVLWYDARGHGESATRHGRPYAYTGFSPVDWQLMIKDLGAAVRYVAGRGGAKQQIVCVGASLGANICLVYAAAHPTVSRVMALSPGVQYAGISTDDVMENLQGRPVLLAAARQDRYAYETCALLTAHSSRSVTVRFLPAAQGHGVGMFDGSFEKQLIAWIDGQR
jgi:alpha-beta hydrolase superfamily lysophospholipase